MNIPIPLYQSLEERGLVGRIEKCMERLAESEVLRYKSIPSRTISINHMKRPTWERNHRDRSRVPMDLSQRHCPSKEKIV
ncbi:hypothetical protein [Bacillus sp. AFS015802]|uniref:hypothetical protein n=1 Tax=Bacillus sp. AFS015802 TaxID=2033486 RepID=UPI0015CF2BDA|nr:hypothetical protein [Bacillus sp. AFS015802]